MTNSSTEVVKLNQNIQNTFPYENEQSAKFQDEDLLKSVPTHTADFLHHELEQSLSC